MRHPSRASMRSSRRQTPEFQPLDSSLEAEHSDAAKANARAGALHGVVLAVGILLVVISIILITHGCASAVTVAEVSIPFLFLNQKPLLV